MKKMRERRLDVVERVNWNVGRISIEEVRTTIEKMKNRKQSDLMIYQLRDGDVWKKWQ